MLSRSAAVLTALFATAGWATGQQFIEFGGASFSEPWSPALSNPGQFGRSGSGDWNGDGALDLFTLDGESVTALFSADTCFAGTLAHSAARDACALLGAPERIAVVGDSGLEAVELDTLNNAFVTLGIRAGAWSGARIVRCADLDGAGASDLVGIAADGTSVLAVERVAESMFAFVDGSSFQAFATVRDVIALEWDGDAGQELALLTDAGVSVHERTGALLSNWNGAPTGASIARIAQAGLAIDRIAWIAPSNAPGGQRLRTLSPEGVDEALDLGTLDSFATLGRDLDLDGDDDLLIARRSSHTLVWLENARTPAMPSGRSFSSPAAVPRIVPIAPPPSGSQVNTATPVAADFDGDGDVDIVVALESSQALALVRGDVVGEDLLRPDFAGAVYDVDPITLQGSLTLQLVAPLAPPAGATHVQVAVWHQDSVGTPFDPVASSSVLVSWPASFPTSIAIAIPESEWLFADVYRVELTPVRAPAGLVIERFPGRVASLAVYADDVALLESEPSAEPGTAVIAAWPEASGVSSEVVPSTRTGRCRDSEPPSVPPS
jgi:hypothetical protein